MWTVDSLLKRLKRNAFAFTVTFVLSLALSGLWPMFRNLVSWQANYQLCHAAANGRTRTVKALLFFGTNPNGSSVHNQPLHFAARYGQAHTARLLLDAGANVNSVGPEEQTVLMEALYSQNQDATRLLLSRGVSVNALDHQGRSALWHGSHLRNPALLQLLMSYGAARSADSEDALRLAMGTGDVETVRTLVSGGVDPRNVVAERHLFRGLQITNLKVQAELDQLLDAAVNKN